MDLRETMMTRYLISYPKSGRTWLRYVFHSLGVDADILFHHDGFEFNDGSLPAHDYDLARRRRIYHHRDARVVYLRRDPRDIVVSLYHQITGRFDDFFGYKGSISDFLRDPYFGAQVLAQFRELWQQLSQHRTVLVVEYEECHRDLAGVVEAILDHHGFAVAPERVREVCSGASLSQMKAVEESGEFPHPWLNLRNAAPKVRRGRMGNYVEELSADDIDYLDRIFGMAEKHQTQ
jgi:hypothetical protein